MISDPCLADLRMAAVLAYRLPVNVRIGAVADRRPAGCEPDPIIEVSRPPSEPDPRARWLPPCAFRGAVVEAWRMHQEGRTLAFCGLDDDTAVSVDVDAPAAGKCSAGGICEVPWGDETLLAFATTADADLCRRVAAPLEVAVHTDGALAVNLIHVTSPPDDTAGAHDRLVSVLARVTVEELITESAAGRADVD